MKNKINNLLCLLFGCVEFEEVYAIKYSKDNKSKYRIVRRDVCSRCGKEHSDVLRTNLSRVDLLKNEWFIIKNQNF